MTTSSHARLAAYGSWANTVSRTARTLPARNGLDAKFLREARERLGAGATDGQVRDAADAARHAHFVRMARERWSKAAPRPARAARADQADGTNEAA